MRKRNIGFVGDEFTTRAGGVARPLPAGPIIGSYKCRRELIPYSYSEDYYLVPAVYRDSSTEFFERHESRIENLAEEGSPKVLITIVRRDAANPIYTGEDEDSEDSAF